MHPERAAPVSTIVAYTPLYGPNVPRRFTIYLPRNPVAPKTVAVWPTTHVSRHRTGPTIGKLPPRDDLPPCVRIIGFPVLVMAMSDKCAVCCRALCTGLVGLLAVRRTVVRLDGVHGCRMVTTMNPPLRGESSTAEGRSQWLDATK